MESIFSSRCHKKNAGPQGFSRPTSKNNVKPNRGMTKYEKLQIKLEMACLVLGGRISGEAFKRLACFVPN